LKLFKGHGSGAGSKVEKGDESSVGRIETSKYVGDKIFIFNRLTCSNKQV
jgi:hypothetical protein